MTIEIDKHVVVGFDIETTGLDHNRHAPLTIGMAWQDDLGDFKTLHRTVDVFNPSIHDWDAEAYVVNGIDPFARAEFSKSYSYADKILFDCISESMKVYVNDPSIGIAELIPTGWNVYGFDMRFMSHYFPETSKLFRYSSLAELNTMCHIASRIKGENFYSLKRKLKEQAKETMMEGNSDVAWQQAHNAAYDALESLIIYSNLMDIFDSFSKTPEEITEIVIGEG